MTIFFVVFRIAEGILDERECPLNGNGKEYDVYTKKTGVQLHSSVYSNS